MESRIHGDMYVRFGGRLVETYYRKVEKRCWPSLLKEIADVCGLQKICAHIQPDIATRLRFGQKSNLFKPDSYKVIF